ncbi:TRF4 [Auxenochlorella protothecoides x Auxenochlorella symbiontica]
MAQRRKSETTLTPVHEGSSAYRYTKFAVLGSALTPRSKESLVVEAVSASVEVVHPADTSTAQTSIVRNRPATAGRPEGAKERSPESGVESGELPESSPNGAQDREPEEAAVQSVIQDLFDDFISFGGSARTPAAPAKPEPSEPALLDKVPWHKSIWGIESASLRLHHEIVELARYLTPLPEEAMQRNAAIQRVRDVVACIWPEAQVKVFGSFATGLYLPTSDIDAVVLGSGCEDVPQGLKALASALHRKHLAKDIQVITKAKVPIIKFEETESCYKFDISFDVANGPEAAESVRALMDVLPPMRHLVMVLKVFLHQRDLNEVYAGGLGSYALLVLVAAFLQLHPSRQPSRRFGKGPSKPEDLEQNLGILLIDFFRLYGRTLNTYDVGVSCRNGGAYIKKSASGFYSSERPYLLAVEDPCDPTNDLARNSYNISRVRAAFEYAYLRMVAPSSPKESILARVLRLDPVLFMRTPVAHPESPQRPHKKSRKKRKSESPAAQEAAEKQNKKKRKHRERSLSLEEEGAAPAAREDTRNPSHPLSPAPIARSGQDGHRRSRRREAQGLEAADGIAGHSGSSNASGSRHIRFD